MSILKQNRTRILSLVATLVYAIIYSLISIWNHYVFRTFAYDLGIKNQVLWDYAHLRMNYNTVLDFLGGSVNILANHFEPVIMLFAPLYYVFGSYTLLVVQIFFLLFGGWGIRRLIIYQSGNEWLALTGMLVFYSMWGVFGALSFDFHTNVIAASVVPWFLAYAFEKRWVQSALILLFIILCKENMALWAVFLALGMAIHYWNEKKYRWIYFSLSITSLVFFILIMKAIMPYYADGKIQYHHFKYTALGETMEDALLTFLTAPSKWIPLIWKSPLESSDPFIRDSKIWLHTAVVLSGGILLLARPYFIIMLIPIYAQKLFFDEPNLWGIFYHYSIEFVPVITAGTFTVLAGFKSWRVQLLSAALLLISVADVTKDFMDRWHPNSYKSHNIKFYSNSHYLREINYKAYHKILSYYIPKDAAVSANTYLVPHLAFRKKIYQFPVIKDADYVVVCDDFSNYHPFSPDERHLFLSKRDSLEASPEFNTIFKDQRMVILKRSRHEM